MKYLKTFKKISENTEDHEYYTNQYNILMTLINTFEKILMKESKIFEDNGYSITTGHQSFNDDFRSYQLSIPNDRDTVINDLKDRKIELYDTSISTTIIIKENSEAQVGDLEKTVMQFMMKFTKFKFRVVNLTPANHLPYLVVDTSIKEHLKSTDNAFKKINEDNDIDYHRENVNIIKNSVPIFRNVIQQIIDKTEFKDIKIQENALLYTVDEETGDLDMVLSEYIETEEEYFLEYDSIIDGTYLDSKLTFIIEINNSIITHVDQWSRPVKSEEQYNYGPFRQKTTDLIRKLEKRGFVCQDSYLSSSTYNEILVSYKVSDIMKMSSNAMKKINENSIDSRTPSFDRLLSMQELDKLDENIVYDFKKVFPWFVMEKLKDLEYAEYDEIKSNDWVVATYFMGGMDTYLFKIEEFDETGVDYENVGRGDHDSFYGIGLAYNLVKYETILGDFLDMKSVMKKINQ